MERIREVVLRPTLRFWETLPKDAIFFLFAFFSLYTLHLLARSLGRLHKPKGALHRAVIPPIFSLSLSTICASSYNTFNAIALWTQSNTDPYPDLKHIGHLYALADASDSFADIFLFLTLIIITYQRRKDLVAEVQRVRKSDVVGAIFKSRTAQVYPFIYIGTLVAGRTLELICRLTSSDIESLTSGQCHTSDTSFRYSIYLALLSVSITGFQLYNAVKKISGSPYSTWDKEVLLNILVYVPCCIWLRTYMAGSNKLGTVEPDAMPTWWIPGLGPFLVRSFAFVYAVGVLLDKKSIRTPSFPSGMTVLDDIESPSIVETLGKVGGGSLGEDLEDEKLDLKAQEVQPLLIVIMDEDSSP